MNMLKFGRGDFFGIIIPGAFLLTNVGVLTIAIGPRSIVGLLSQLDAALLLPALFVVSYVMGVALRAVSPDDTEKLASWVVVSLLWLRLKVFLLRILELFVHTLFFQDAKNSVKRNSLDVQEQLTRKLERFPYFRAFGRSLESAPKSYRCFFLNLVANETEAAGTDLLPIDIEERIRGLMGGHKFINKCKYVVYERSDSLRDELIFCEGLSRFLSGMFLALTGSSVALITLMVRVSPSIWTIALAITYFILIQLFGRKLKTLRYHEVLAILDSFAIVSSGADSPQNPPRFLPAKS